MDLTIRITEEMEENLHLISMEEQIITKSAAIEFVVNNYLKLLAEKNKIKLDI